MLRQNFTRGYILPVSLFRIIALMICIIVVNQTYSQFKKDVEYYVGASADFNDIKHNTSTENLELGIIYYQAISIEAAAGFTVSENLSTLVGFNYDQLNFTTNRVEQFSDDSYLHTISETQLTYTGIQAAIHYKPIKSANLYLIANYILNKVGSVKDNWTTTTGTSVPFDTILSVISGADDYTGLNIWEHNIAIGLTYEFQIGQNFGIGPFIKYRMNFGNFNAGASSGFGIRNNMIQAGVIFRQKFNPDS